MRSIVKSTDAYEEWVRERTDVSEKLLEKKHRKMSEGAFPFLRATFYRWVEQWPAVCPKLARRDQDVLLAVGDLHVENFGVWRDSRQRLVWGVNDFDDACELPFTSDLVRLATSAMLAASAAKIKVTADTVCAFMIEGYRTGLVKAEPILIPANGNGPLTKLTHDTQEEPKEFWRKKLDADENPEVDRSRSSEGPRGHVSCLVPCQCARDIPQTEVARRTWEPRPPPLHRCRDDQEGRLRRTRSKGARAFGALLVEAAGPHAVADGDAAAARDSHP